ncbi:MAG: inositol monophosphatase family protein [Acidimicrobiales bacterium]
MSLTSDDRPPVDAEIVEFAVELVRTAGNLTLRWFASVDLQVDTKADGTPVTAADRTAERWLREQLAKHCPDDGIIGEEEPPSAGSSGRRWIVDPIDGTKAFTRGVPLYSTLLAFEDEHGGAVGVIGLPALDQAVWAGRGRGCSTSSGAETRPARVSATPTIATAYLTSSGYSHWPEPALLACKRSGADLRTWGDGYGYALVATGRVDAMVDPVVDLYDVAAMPVILAEAGGRFTSLGGDPSPAAGSGVATNGLIHDELLALINEP